MRDVPRQRSRPTPNPRRGAIRLASLAHGLRPFGRSESNGPEQGSVATESKGLGRWGCGDVAAWFYMLRLSSGMLYPGATTDLDRRYREHCEGVACRTTKVDPPRDLVYSEELPTFAEARRREAQVKRWSRAKKEALAAGDLETLHQLARSRAITAREQRARAMLPARLRSFPPPRPSQTAALLGLAAAHCSSSWPCIRAAPSSRAPEENRYRRIGQDCIQPMDGDGAGFYVTAGRKSTRTARSASS